MEWLSVFTASWRVLFAPPRTSQLGSTHPAPPPHNAQAYPRVLSSTACLRYHPPDPWRVPAHQPHRDVCASVCSGTAVSHASLAAAKRGPSSVDRVVYWIRTVRTPTAAGQSCVRSPRRCSETPRPAATLRWPIRSAWAHAHNTSFHSEHQQPTSSYQHPTVEASDCRRVTVSFNF